MEYKKKTLIWEDNSEPPKDYIWIKADGKAYEFDYTTRTWVESKTIKSASGSGSGSTEGAITYNEQELTEEQQMQARKNQGLYYSTVGNGEKTAYFPQDNLKNQTWAYTITDEQIASLTAGASFATFIKVSDDCPQKEELVSYRTQDIDISLLDPHNIVVPGVSSVFYIQQETGYYYGLFSEEWGGDFDGADFLVVTDDNVNNIELTGIYSVDGENYAVANNLSKGIWAKLRVTPQGSSEESDWTIDRIGFSQFVYNGEVEQIVGVETKYTNAISYSEQQDLSVTQQMQARANQGLYGITEADNVLTSLIINDDSRPDRMEDLSDLIPAGSNIESITAFRFSGSESIPADKLVAINGEPISSNVFFQSEDYWKCLLSTSDGPFILCSIDNDNTSVDLVGDGSAIATLDKGIWVVVFRVTSQ